MSVLGLDPGKKGGYGIVNEDGTVQVYGRMPLIGKDFDTALLAELFDRADHAGIEKVGAMPGQGVTSMFNFGYGYGLLCGIAKGKMKPHTLVRPQAWQKVMLAGLGGGTKEAAVQRCLQLWPETADFFRVKANQGASDALLIAEYIRRTMK